MSPSTCDACGSDRLVVLEVGGCLPLDDHPCVVEVSSSDERGILCLRCGERWDDDEQRPLISCQQLDVDMPGCFDWWVDGVIRAALDSAPAPTPQRVRPSGSHPDHRSVRMGLWLQSNHLVRARDASAGVRQAARRARALVDELDALLVESRSQIDAPESLLVEVAALERLGSAAAEWTALAYRSMDDARRVLAAIEDNGDSDESLRAARAAVSEAIERAADCLAEADQHLVETCRTVIQVVTGLEVSGGFRRQASELVQLAVEL